MKLKLLLVFKKKYVMINEHSVFLFLSQQWIQRFYNFDLYSTTSQQKLDVLNHTWSTPHLRESSSSPFCTKSRARDRFLFICWNMHINDPGEDAANELHMQQIAHAPPICTIVCKWLARLSCTLIRTWLWLKYMEAKIGLKQYINRIKEKDNRMGTKTFCFCYKRLHPPYINSSMPPEVCRPWRTMLSKTSFLLNVVECPCTLRQPQPEHSYSKCYRWASLQESPRSLWKVQV